MYNAYGEEEPCTYFDLTIAINTITSLAEKLSCEQENVQDAESLLTAIPREIASNNLNFRMNGLYTLRYPQDFSELKLKSNGKGS